MGGKTVVLGLSGGVDAAVKHLLHSITSVFPCQILFFPKKLPQSAARLKHYI